MFLVNNNNRFMFVENTQENDKIVYVQPIYYTKMGGNTPSLFLPKVVDDEDLKNSGLGIYKPILVRPNDFVGARINGEETYEIDMYATTFEAYKKSVKPFAFYGLEKSLFGFKEIDITPERFVHQKEEENNECITVFIYFEVGDNFVEHKLNQEAFNKEVYCDTPIASEVVEYATNLSEDVRSVAKFLNNYTRLKKGGYLAKLPAKSLAEDLEG